MKIGVVSSGFDVLSLFNFLNKYDHEYVVYFDWNNGPYGDKDFEFGVKKVEDGIHFLNNENVDKIIVPPMYELFLQDTYPNILPIFKTYLLDYCAKFSLVGKIGFVGDYSDMQAVQTKFKEITNEYQLTSNQKNIKKFNFPFSIWRRETGLWKHFLQKISYRNFALSKIIKFDLNHLKDAGIDTVVPLNYGYFALERLIKNKFNLNKTRFHGIEVLEEIFVNLVLKSDIENGYKVSIYCNGGEQIIKNEKKWLWLLQKGKGSDLKINSI